MSSLVENTPNWLDKKFLESSLRSAECDNSLTVLSCNLSRATSTGDNYLSEMFRAILKVARGNCDEKEEISVIIKCSPQNEIVEKFASELEVFERETEVFTVVLPELHTLLEEVSPGKYQPFGAKCLYHQTISNTSILVLEDLKKQGFQMAERRRGLDFDHCMLVIRTIARYHAASIAFHERDPGYVKPFLTRGGSKSTFQREKLNDFFSGCLISLADEIDTWSDSQDFDPEGLRTLARNLENKMFDIVERNDDEINVLTHGDLWVNNMMFQYDSSGQVKDVRFVDYQIGHWTTPAIDILYFLHTSPNVELWNKQDVFIQEYHKTLGESLELFDLKHLHVTLQDLYRILEQRAFHAVFAAVLVLPIVLLDPDNPLNLDEVFEKDVENSVVNQRMHSSKEYIKAIRKCLPKFKAQDLY